MNRLRSALVALAVLAAACSDAPPADPADSSPADTSPAVAADETPAPELPAAAADDAEATPSAPVTDVAPIERMPKPGPDAVWLEKGLMIGTWSMHPELGMDEAWIDEEGLRETFTKVRVKRREWRGFGAESKLIPLDLLMKRKEGPIFGYVYSLVQRNRQDGVWPDEQAVLHVTYRGPIKAWFDGELLFDLGEPLGSVATARVPVVLTDAYDVLLLKLGADDGTSMNIEVALTDPEGGAIEAMTWNTVRIPGIPREIGPRER